MGDDAKDIPGAQEALADRIARLRQEAQLTQIQLAEKADLNQSCVSRMEGGRMPKNSVLAIVAIAKVLGMAPRELVAGTAAELLFASLEEQQETFLAYCPNPLCCTNEIGRRRDSSPSVRWASAAEYPMHEYEETNFCPFCRERLRKVCPGCERPIASAYERFCTKCGAALRERPTDEEWARIEKILAEREAEGSSGDKTPF